MSITDAFLNLANQTFDGALALHPERCLNARFRAIGCTRCAEACPAEDAITISDGRPALNSQACFSCGLCLHYCPTQAFTRPDGWSHQVVRTVTALPAGPVDLICPQHPNPDDGPAPQAVQTKRCLVALTAATLLELSSTKASEIWLDDRYCAACPLGKVQGAMQQTVAEANGWASLLEEGQPISFRSETDVQPVVVERSVYDADRPPNARRGLFNALKAAGEEVAAAQEPVEMLKSGRSVPVSERLPQSVPSQRNKILSFLKKNRLRVWPPDPSLPQFPQIRSVVNITADPSRCTACTLCARFCPTGALQFLSDGEQFVLTFEPAHCLGQACNICSLACPEQAIVSKPATVSPDLLIKKPLATGKLGVCQRCKQPVAKGSNLPTTCFACRPRCAF